ncbi:MAG: outer membrane protein assembly factor BamD, partial [Candidatus Marinimicrobia bacterium]|nr:outer membrane protein assembly factor BamD [Candidatus Neomarinimicrobiota bacterium]MBT6797174.1 outer membrane protein assembly factor BamD [Candidatus Neomarinimicrobiota bacterium]
KQVVIRGTGSDLGDDAQYYLAESYYRNEEYLDAISEYEKLTRRMGFSEFIEDARFKICEAYRIESPTYFHDQQYTEKALERYQEFLDDFPQSKYRANSLESIETMRNKMGKKLHEAGILYMKMEEYESAKMTFTQVIDKYYDTEMVFMARQELVKAMAYNREIDEAISFLNENKQILQEHDLFEDAKGAIHEIQNVILKEQK